MQHKVLVAIDDSETSRHVASFVRELFGASVEVLGINVAQRPQPWIAPGVGYGVVFPAAPMTTTDSVMAAEEQLQREAREEAGRALTESGLEDAAALGAVGDPVVAIAAAAEEHDVDLIAVGGDEAGFLGRLLDRSVARALLHDAARPVLVVPPTGSR